MDGVLIDSGAHHRAAWRALLDELGVVPAERDYWRLTIGRPSVEAVPLLLGRETSWAEAQRLAARKQEHYRRLAGGGPALVRGVAEFVAELAARERAARRRHLRLAARRRHAPDSRAPARPISRSSWPPRTSGTANPIPRSTC